MGQISKWLIWGHITHQKKDDFLASPKMWTIILCHVIWPHYGSQCNFQNYFRSQILICRIKNYFSRVILITIRKRIIHDYEYFENLKFPCYLNWKATKIVETVVIKKIFYELINHKLVSWLLTQNNMSNFLDLYQINCSWLVKNMISWKIR